MIRDSFVFYRSFAEAVKELDAETYKSAMEAILDYALDGIEPQTTGIAKAMYLMAKPQIDANNKRFLNGARGGRKPNANRSVTETEPNRNQTETEVKPNRNQTVTKLEPNSNQTITETEPKPNQTETKPEPNVNVNVNVNVNDKKHKYICSKFGEFWSEYPRKVGKANAEAVYKRKAVNAETEQAILDGLRRYNSLQWSKWTGEQRQYIPYPASWLNAGRWTDTVEQTGKSVPKYMSEAITEPDTAVTQTDLDALKELMDKL